MTKQEAARLIRIVAAQFLLDPRAVTEQDPKILDAAIESIIISYQNMKSPFIKKED